MRASVYLRYLLNINWKVRYEIVRILFMIIKARIMVRYIPLKYYYSRFICTQNDKCLDLQPFREHICLINRVMKAVPWDVTCLMESLVIQSYFKRYFIHVPIYIGVKTGNELKAHSWYSESKRFSYQILSINE